MSTMTGREMLELEVIKNCLSYNKETGQLLWIKTNSNVSVAGSIAGRSLNSDGYKHVTVAGIGYKAHRLAWLLTYGKWPKGQIDHIDGDRQNNRIANLREASSQTNTHNQRLPHKNNRSGFLGVIKRPSGRYAAEIRVNKKKVYLGTYDSAEEAHSAYVENKRKYHPGSTL